MKIYFFDDQRIATRVNTERIYGFPKEIQTNSKNKCDSFGLPTVIKGTEIAPYIMYYLEGKEVMYNGVLQKKTFYLLAKSDDCINWEPVKNDMNFNIKEFDNQIFDVGNYSDILACVYDEKEKEDRFRLIVCEFDWAKGDYEIVNKMLVSYDGIHFKEKPCNINPNGCEAYAGHFYNNLKDCHTFIIRPAWADRRSCVTETKDFVNFTPLKLAVQVDSLDEREAEIYGMPTFNLDGVFLGLPHIFHTTSDDYGLANKYKGGHMDFELAYSYDGEVFQRSLRKPFINHGTPHDSRYGMITCYSMTPVDDKYIMTCNFTTNQHGMQNPNAVSEIKSFEIKKDRFIGLESIGGAAVLKTRGLIFDSDKLNINIEVPYGYAVARLVDDDKKTVLEGFDYSNCEQFNGDSLNWSPKWTGGKLTDINDRVVSLEIKFYNGVLWAIDGDFVMSYTTMASRRYNNFKIRPPKPVF